MGAHCKAQGTVVVMATLNLKIDSILRICERIPTNQESNLDFCEYIPDVSDLQAFMSKVSGYKEDDLPPPALVNASAVAARGRAGETKKTNATDQRIQIRILLNLFL